ncbi:COMM domain-containing protein 5-like [Polistes fuscatus]|uniref:COMM domain-containing protein 5-like n=1 Tax=Polistes fuscatus TaxID=30207 RepID=UPI001CAA3B9F|nr:COMM domain-containing protein 5-like [Polistes fuscatus]
MATLYQTQLLTALGNKTKHLAELKKTFVRPLIQIAVKAIEQEHIEGGILERISQKYNIPLEDVDEYFSAVFIILKTYLKYVSCSVKPTEFKQTLEELKLPSDCIEDLYTVVSGQKKADLLTGLMKKTKFFPRLISCKWRIDVVISSNVLSRVLEPCIILECIFDTGETHSFELSLAQFHRFRHAVASILVEIQSLEQRNALKNIQHS